MRKTQEVYAKKDKYEGLNLFTLIYKVIEIFNKI